MTQNQIPQIPQDKLALATQMLQNRKTVKQIAKATGLTVKFIQNNYQPKN